MTANTAAQEETLGIERVEIDDTYGVQKYIYIKNASGTAFADGTVGVMDDDYGRTVSTTIGNTAAAVNKAMGVAFGTITASYFGWIQKYGYHDYVLNDAGGDIDDGDGICADQNSAPGVCELYDAGATDNLEARYLGVAVADDDTTSVAAFLVLP